MNALNDGLAELANACAEENINLLALIGRTARWAKACLRVRAFELYRWVCPIDDAPELGRKISEGWKPERYPSRWRDPERSDLAIDFARTRRSEFLRHLTTPPGLLYPSEPVRVALNYWTTFQTSIYGETTFPVMPYAA